MTIYNISEILNKLDSNVNTYNGAILPIPKTNFHLCAYRATIKPDNLGPPFPYTNLDNLWFNKDNYIGLVIIDLDNFVINKFCKYIHNIHEKMSNYEYVQYLKKINKKNHPELKFNNLLAGPEDPRLYYKNDKIYMNYNNILITPEADCPGECLGMFEILININILLSVNVYYPNNDKKLICNKVNNQFLFKEKKTHGELTLKNWSYAPGFFIDSYKDKAFLYEISKNVSVCKKKPYIKTLQPFIQDDWSIALTTPTVLYNDELYGVVHIRVPYKNISASDQISYKLKQIIYKGDVHNNDFYFMSVYKIHNNKWSLTKPILITGNVKEKYYSYNVNFPCGFFITKQQTFNITFGLGDCLLFLYNGNINSLNFYNKKFNYNDIKVIEVNNLMLKKEYIHSFICNTNENLIKYLLPKNIRLFDLGGSGLKTVLYNSVSNKYSSIINLGKSDILNLPEQIIRKHPSVQDEILSGVSFGFSLASLGKLWVESIRKEAIELVINKKYNSTNELFNLINKKTIEINASTSHLFGSMSEYKSKFNIPLNNLNFVNIAIGTDVNMSFSNKGKIKHEIGVNFWDIKIENSSIRKNFNNLTEKKLVNLLQVFFNLIPNNRKMSSTWPTKWPTPDIITLSGGGSIPYNKINIKFNNIHLLVFSDQLIPYKGLIHAFKSNICDLF